MGDAPKSRIMKYPYTTSAEIMKFPYKHYLEKCWLVKYYLIASIFCLPIFWKIEKLSCTEENKKKWYEIRRKQFEGHH